MAEKFRSPQIPSTVWWGIRALLNKTPNATFDDRALSIQLNVQPTAAKQYVAELTAAGILSDEGKATPLANKWRLDTSYPVAVAELLKTIYPQSLLDVAPPSDGNRSNAVSWFQQEGLGEGAAKNKAATYFLIGSSVPNEAPGRSGRKASNDEPTTKVPKRAAKSMNQPNGNKNTGESTRADSNDRSGLIPLNVNVQIHISADAGSEQIESIFAAMRRYLNEKQIS